MPRDSWLARKCAQATKIRNAARRNSSQSSKSIVINNFIGDYDDAVIDYSNLKPAPENSENSWPVMVSALVNRQKLTPDQPPEC